MSDDSHENIVLPIHEALETALTERDELEDRIKTLETKVENLESERG